VALGAYAKERDMSGLHFTRRAVLAGLASAAALGPAQRALAEPAPDGLRFRDIRLDLSPLHGKDEDEEAAWVAAKLPVDLKQTLGAHFAPGDRGAGVLLVRIDNVLLGNPYTRMGFGFMATDTTDSIDGEARALDARGRVIGTYPLFCAVGADSREGLPDQQDIRRWRVETLALSFAQWLPGKMGL
jgi:hypothetical protein